MHSFFLVFLGVTRSFFSEEKKEPKKSRLGLSPAYVSWVGRFFSGDLYIGSVFTSFCRFIAPRVSGAFCFSQFVQAALYYLYRFGIPRMEGFLFRQVTPAPCSPPLGGSGAGSAVRFTAAESRAAAKTGHPAAKPDV